MRYCPSCREFAPGLRPPYSLLCKRVMVGEAEVRLHLDPETRESCRTLEDLTEAWHSGEFPDDSLEDVIRRKTGWNAVQYGEWVATAKMPDPK